MGTCALIGRGYLENNDPRKVSGYLIPPLGRGGKSVCVLQGPLAAVSDCACLLKRTQKRAGQLLQQNPGLAQALDENLASYVLMYTAES